MSKWVKDCNFPTKWRASEQVVWFEHWPDDIFAKRHVDGWNLHFFLKDRCLIRKHPVAKVAELVPCTFEIKVEATSSICSLTPFYVRDLRWLNSSHITPDTRHVWPICIQIVPFAYGLGAKHRSKWPNTREYINYHLLVSRVVGPLPTGRNWWQKIVLTTCLLMVDITDLNGPRRCTSTPVGKTLDSRRLGGILAAEKAGPHPPGTPGRTEAWKAVVWNIGKNYMERTGEFLRPVLFLFFEASFGGCYISETAAPCRVKRLKSVKRHTPGIRVSIWLKKN